MSEVRQHSLDFTDEDAGLRLDQALARHLTEYSRSNLKAWIDAGNVTVNSQPCKPRQIVRPGDRVEVRAELRASVDIEPEPVPFDVLHEDEALLVVEKPAGVVTHPGAGHASGTLVNGLIQRFPELRALPRAGLIHRLDKDTSGILIVGRDSASFQQLTDMMAAREIHRTYAALACGEFVAGGTIEAPIGRHPRHRTRMAVRDGGRDAVTHFRIREKFRAHTLLDVSLETGRTHQIRVHLAHSGHPIVGDTEYGARPTLPPRPSEDLRHAIRAFPRQALHAKFIEFMHPSHGKSVTVESPLPRDIETLLQICRNDRAGANE